MKQGRFNYYLSSVLIETPVRTPGAGGEYIHYEIGSRYDKTINKSDIDWIAELQSNGFVLHNRANSELEDIYLTSDRFLCRATCVCGYVNVMFFSSLADLSETHKKTIKFINKLNKVKR